MSLSGSKIHTAVECAASEVLPAIERDYDPEPALRGQAIHRYLERALELGPDAALAEAPERFRTYLATIDFDEVPKGLAAEVSFAWHVKGRTARELGRNLDRKYDQAGLDRATEIPLTLDLVGLDRARGVGFVRDWKSGHGRLPRPRAYGQTMLGGLVVCKAYGLDVAQLELTYLESDGDFYTVRDDVDLWDLETYGDRIEATVDRITKLTEEYAAGITPDVREGPWCDYCPGYKACPAKTALVRVFPGMVEKVGAPGYLAPDRIADTFHTIEGLREILGRIEGEIFALAAYEPITLRDGRILGPKTTTRESYAGSVAMAVLTDLYGAEAATEAARVTVSKEALREAIAKRRKPKEKLQTKAGDGLIDRAEAEIKSRGGLEYSRTTAVRVYRPKRLPGA